MERLYELYSKVLPFLDVRKALATGSRTPKRRLAVIFPFVLLMLWILLPYETKAFLLYQQPITAYNLKEIKALTCPAETDKACIPNTIHFVYILQHAATDFPFQFSHFLSLYAASYRWQPNKIYLHTNVESNSETVMRARNGESGKWSKLVFDLPNFTVNTVTVPTHAGNGQKIISHVHQSDFVRVQAVHDFGGIYIDMDVHALRDIKPLRNLGFKAVGGRQLVGELNSGTFMSAKGSKLIKGWLNRMNEVYDGGWTTHSNGALTHVAESLENEPCEMLTLGRDAFAPGGWGRADKHRLWDTHPVNNIPIENTTQDLRSESDRHTEDTIAQRPLPIWAQDWSCSFLLHAFSSKNPRSGSTHNDITPRSVLERGSNFAQAVYPVAKVLLEAGMIDVDDSDTGF